MPFSLYMELCLYHPEFGYYSRNAQQFGKAGDFYTSSDVHAVFGRLLARQFDQMWRALGLPSNLHILELGPGRGLFARDVLAWSEKKFPDFFAALHYCLVESSPALRSHLEQTLEQYLLSGKASVCDALAADVRSPVLIFANEFFDAFPVEILSSEGKLQIAERDGKLVEVWASPSEQELDYLDRYSVHPECGERIEVPLAAQAFMTRLCAALNTGILTAIDYGFTRQEQLAGRHRGTLAAFRQHSTSSNPYESPGEQDLTAHVNFTALRAAAEQSGLHVQPLLTQSQFLMGIGEPNQFADAFEDCRLPQEKAKVALQLKHLVTPAGMGETFHVLIASKNVDPASLESLDGLSYLKNRD